MPVVPSTLPAPVLGSTRGGAYSKQHPRGEYVRQHDSHASLSNRSGNLYRIRYRPGRNRCDHSTRYSSRQVVQPDPGSADVCTRRRGGSGSAHRETNFASMSSDQDLILAISDTPEPALGAALPSIPTAAGIPAFRGRCVCGSGENGCAPFPALLAPLASGRRGYRFEWNSQIH